jgi:hypothetical protein
LNRRTIGIVRKIGGVAAGMSHALILSPK